MVLHYEYKGSTWMPHPCFGQRRAGQGRAGCNAQKNNIHDQHAAFVFGFGRPGGGGLSHSKLKR